MAMQYVLTAGIQIVGDGVATTFTIPPSVFVGIGLANQTQINPNLFPVAATVRNSPVAVNSTTFDGNGNLIITFNSAWANGQTATVYIDFTYNSGTTQPFPETMNMTQVNGTAVPTGTGASGAGVQRVTVSNDSAIKIWDGTNVAGVDALLSQKTTTPDRSVAISLTAVGQTTQISLEGRASMGFNISNIGTGGQLVVEGSIDGSNWFGIDIWSEFNETWIINPATVSSVGNWWAEPVGAMQAIRVRVTALTSGTITGTMLADNFYMGTFEFQASDGSTYPNNLIAVGGQGIDGNVHGLRTDSQGNLQVAVTPATSGTFTTFGDITTAVIAKVVVRETTYNEQAANAIRSISSSSANDTAAGTGARTVKINFMTLAGVTGSETITLNGTTAVATTNSFAYIESIIVLTVGTGGSNAGTLTVFVNNAGGGGTFATIAAGTNRSFWAHHYVATGKICRITGVCVGHNGTTTGSGGLFSLAAITLNASNQPEVQISDFVRLYGQSSTVTRNYGSPITVTGPARIVHYVTPETSTSTNYKAAFDFFEG